MIETSTGSKLIEHHKTLRSLSLKQLFQASPNRFTTFSIEAAGLFVDYSKNWITSETIDLLSQFALERKLPQAIQALFSGEKINLSEQRPALHAILRLPQSESFLLDGHDVAAEVQSVFQQIEIIADQLEQKKLLGFSGKPIDTILHVGMGGSGLGPALYYQSMNESKRNATCHFLTEFDYATVQAKLALCNPETTIAVIVSKSFSTEETLTIYKTIQAWFGHHENKQSHFYAVTARVDRALAQGFSADHILKIWDWVGGRYSIWSAVSFANILTFGIDHFRRFLSGAHAMDQHFQQAPLQSNLPVVMAMLAVWYNNFFHAYSTAIVPYSSQLALLPSYLQQLQMESLGKNISLHGEEIDYPTGRVVWGDVGPSSQHSFHQLLMQGSQLIPVDFILPFHSHDLNEYDIKRAAYCLSQSQTLLQGFDTTESAYEFISGDRPSTTICIDHFTPETLGALLALYEHIVFAKSVIWGINAFDQWGVERGKRVAQELVACFADEKSVDAFDSSTQGLLARISRRVQK